MQKRRRKPNGNGYYRLPSGTMIHLQAEKPPTPETLAALDELGQAVIKPMQSGDLPSSLDRIVGLD